MYMRMNIEGSTTMSEKVVLELTDTISQRAHEISQKTGQPLETILLDWLERSAASADIYPLIADSEYQIETPYGNEDAAKTLMDFLESTKGRLT